MKLSCRRQITTSTLPHGNSPEHLQAGAVKIAHCRFYFDDNPATTVMTLTTVYQPYHAFPCSSHIHEPFSYSASCRLIRHEAFQEVFSEEGDRLITSTLARMNRVATTATQLINPAQY